MQHHHTVLSFIQNTFEQVVKEFYDDVYRFAWSLAKSEADAADLTQQAFLRYAKKGDQIKDRRKVKSWLFSVLRNEFTDGLRKKGRYPHVEILPSDEGEVAEEAPSRQADWSVAMGALQELPETFREPLALYFLEGYTYQEIADVLKIPTGTVMSRLSRGKSRLKEIVNLKDGKNRHG